jgi:hypothetical protein
VWCPEAWRSPLPVARLIVLRTDFLVRLEKLASLILANTLVPLEKLAPVEFQRLAAFFSQRLHVPLWRVSSLAREVNELIIHSKKATHAVFSYLSNIYFFVSTVRQGRPSTFAITPLMQDCAIFALLLSLTNTLFGDLASEPNLAASIL